MKRLVKSAVWMAAALVATAMVNVTFAEEPASGNLQGSWNDYPAKWIGNYDVPTVTPPADEIPPATDYPPETPTTPIPPTQIIPPQTPPGGYPPGLIPPRQQQQGKPSGGGFAWGGGKTGGSGSFGGKQGGSFSWGKTKPPQSQQGVYPRPNGGQGTPSQAQLLEYIRALQAQNAQLRALLERLAGQQGMNDGRSPDMPSDGVPLP